MALPTDVNPFVQFTSGESLEPSGDRGDEISQSIKFRPGLPSGNYLLKKNFSSDGTAFTISYWAKKHNLSYTDHFGNINTSDGSYPGGAIGRNFSDNSGIHNQRNVAAYSFNFDHQGYAMSALTDHSGWNHYVWTRASGTASNRLNVYVNGVQRCSSVDSLPSGDPIWPIAGGDWNQIPGGNIASDLGGYWGGLYMAEWHYIDGTVYAPTTFGRFNEDGVWVPKTVTGVTYGTQGHYLKFDPTDTPLGVATDSSGQGNHWTAISMQESADWRLGRDVGIKDTPTNNISILNRLQPNCYSDVTFSSGALTATAGATVEAYTVSPFPCRQKTYWETYIEAVGGGVVGMINVEKFRDYTLGFAGGNSFGWNAPGNFYFNGSSNPAGSLSPSSWTTGDTLMQAYDPATGKYWTGKNGTWDNSGNPGTGANPTWTWPNAGTRTLMSPGVGPYNATYSVNFGQYDYTYTVPTGFDAHKMDRGTNLTIKDPSEHFDIIQYDAANPSAAKTLTGLSFQPDFVWIKCSNTTYSHQLFDSVRGATKVIYSDLNNVENTNAQTLTSFNSDGFTVGTNASVNNPGDNYVAYCWKAGTSFTPSQTGGLSNLSGSRNTDAGFSIVKYNGNGGSLATVGHGLNEAPQVILVKRLTTADDNWVVYHASIGASYYAHLDTSNMPATNAAYWNNTDPTDSVFTINSASGVNADDDYIAYCWHGVEGYSKIGFYGTGTSDSNGPYVYTGFKPRYVMIFRFNGGNGHWYMYDSERTKQNPRRHTFFANENNANISRSIAFLSTGFRLTDGDADINANNDSYIYWAFAEKPMGGLNVAPMTGE